MKLCRVCNEREVYPRKSANGPFPTMCAECKASDKRPDAQARREKQKAERRARVEEWRAHQRGYYWNNRERIVAQARERRKRIGNGELALQQRFRTYGITAVEFRAAIAAQNGRCAICGTDQPGGQGSFHLDHDHRFAKTDKRGHRGLLCHHCNVGIGCLKDDPTTIEAAAAYLRGHATKLCSVA